jgi:outer membrane autotransporter protein
MRPTIFRHLPVALAVQAVFALPQAQAASFTVNSGTSSTTAQSIVSGDTGTTESGATLTTSGSTAAVTVGTGTTSLTNSGTISQTGTGRTIDANTSTPVFTLTNNAGGLITAAGAEVIRLNRAAGSYLIDNQGTIWQQGVSEDGSRAIKADANFSSTNNRIINGSVSNTGAVIRSNGNDAMRLGSNFTLTNYGSIYSTGVVNTSSANGTGQYLNGIATQGYSAADGVAIEDGRSNVSILNYGAITGPRHGIDGGKPAAADSNLTNLSTTTISAASNSDLISIDRLSVTATSPNGVTFDEIINGVTTLSAQKVTNPVVINYAGGTITGNNGSGVGIDGAGVVINYGTITGNYAGAGNVYRHFTNVATVTWNGEALSTDTSSNGDGDGVDMDGVAYVENWGTIRGTGAGGYDSGGRPNGADGIAAGGGTIINHAGATIYGQSKGILIDDGANGTLTGSTTTTARNVPADSITGSAARIYNEGTITGDKRTAVGLVGDYADLLVNYSTGVITGGKDSVLVDELASTTAAAAVQMGGGADVVVNYGKIEGQNGLAIDMGAGNDLLKLFNGGSTGVIVGTIVGGTGTDTLETGGTQSFASGTLSGFESYIVRDGSTTFDYGLGAITSLQVDAGASLKINGDVSTSGNTVIDGTFKASSVTAPRTMAIGGNLNLGAAATLEAGLGTGTSADKFVVSGTATLTNGATLVPVPRGYVANGAAYTLVSAATLTATPASINVTDNSLLLNYALSQVGQDLVLTATQTASLTSAAAGAGGPIAATLEALGQSGGQTTNDLLAAIFALPTTTDIVAALKQALPDVTQARTQANQQAWQSVFSAFQGRMELARADLPSGAQSGLAAGDATGRRAWVQGLGAWGKQDARAESTGYKVDAYGLAGGIEADRGADEVAGVSLGYTIASSKGTDSAKGDNVRVTGYHAGGYLSRSGADMTLDVSAVLGYNDYESRRQIVFSGFDEVVRGSYSGWQVAGRVEAGFPFALGSSWAGRWLVGARAGYLDTEGYRETGNPSVTQRVAAQDTYSLQSVLGAELIHGGDDGRSWVLRGRYLHEFADAEDTRATFTAGGPSFSVAGVKPVRDTLELGVGYRVVAGNGVRFELGYDAQVKQKFVGHQMSARATWLF